MKRTVVSVAFAALMLLLLSTVVNADDQGGGSGSQKNMINEFLDDIQENTKTAIDGTIGWVWNPTTNACEDPWAPQAVGGSGMSLSLLYPSLIIIFTVVMFTILVYLFGIFFQIQNLIIFAKDQLWESVWALIRVSFFFGVIAAGTGWFGGTINVNDIEHKGIYDGARSTYHIDLAMAFSKNMVYKMSENVGFLLVYNTVIHTIYSATMWVGVTWRAMWSFNLGPALKPLIDLIGMVLQLLFVALGEWIVHLVTLCVIKKWSWSLFIPFALIVYVFPPTRGSGSALLALFLVITLIYPMMFVVNAEVYRVTKYYLSDATGMLNTFFNGGIFGVVGLVGAAMILMGGALAPFLFNSAIAIAFELVKNSLYFIVMMGLLLPFMNIFITLTAARETAKAFGTDVNFMSFIKII